MRHNFGRYFLALPVPVSISEAMQKVCKAAGIEVSWTPLEETHLTLNYFGALSDSELENVTRNMSMTRFSQVMLQVKNISAFTSSSTGQGILSAHLHETRDLQDLRDTAAACAGTPLDTRPFMAHVTLGRSDKPIEIARLTDIRVAPTWVWAPSDIILFVSEKSQDQDAPYRALKKFPLLTNYTL